MTVTEFGAIIGLLTGIFTLVDRFILGRPLVTIDRSEKGKSLRDLRFENIYRHSVLIRRIWSYPRWLRVSADDSVEGIARGAMRERFTALLGPGEVRSFPVTVGRAKLLDPDNNAWAPFVIVVSWRKTQSVWLPQFPRFIFSSARTLRLLSKTK